MCNIYRDLFLLLSESFSARQLRQFVQWRTGGDALTVDLPGDPSTPAQMATAVIGQLERHGLINDQLIADLLVAIPHKRECILNMANSMAIKTDKMAPASISLEAPNARAIIETIVVSGLTLALTVHFNLFFWILSAALLAPLALLRSEQSTALGVLWYSRYEAWLSRKTGIPPITPINAPLDYGSFTPIRVAGMVILQLIGGMMIRLVATARYPVAGAMAIPRNWRHHCLSLNLAHPAAIVPNTHGFYWRGTVPFLGLAFVLLSIFLTAIELSGGDVSSWPIRTWLNRVVVILFAPVFLWGAYHMLGVCLGPVILGTSALLHRLSVKGTALFWIPLLFLCEPPSERRLPVGVYVEYVRESKMAQILRVAAWWTLFAILARIPGVSEVLPAPIQALMSEGDQFEQMASLGARDLFLGLACMSLLVRDYCVIDRAHFWIESGAWKVRRSTIQIDLLTFLIRLCVVLALVSCLAEFAIAVFALPAS